MKIGIITEEVSNEDVTGALTEAGKKLGCEIVVIDQRDCTIHNFAQPAILYNGKPLEAFDACIVRGSLSNYGFRLYLNEYLQNKGIAMYNDAVSFDLCNDKFKTQTFLNRVGIKTPNTVALVKIEQLESAVEALDSKFPMIIKTVSGAHGVGVIKVDTVESLRSIIQLLFATETELMLQEFIDHKESGRIMTIGDRVIAGMMRTIPDGDFRSNLSQGAELKPYVPTEQESAVAIKVAQTLGCKICAVDYILDPNGEMVIFEANSSPGFKGIQSVNTEINIAEEVLKFIMESAGVSPASQSVTIDVPLTSPIGGDQDVTTSHEEEEEVEEGKKKHKHHHMTKAGIFVQAWNTGVGSVVPVSDSSEGADEEEDEEDHFEPSEEVGLSEKIIIKRIQNGEPFEAKIDTGADRCSLGAHVLEIGENFVRFELGDTVYKVPLEKKVRVISANGEESRPIVKFDIEFNGKTYEGVEFNVADREGMKYQVIVGKNLLDMSNVLINPQK